jgi:hypothetical protein
MRIPIKINRSSLPPFLRRIPSKHDPRDLITQPSEGDFEKSVASIKIGDTWKTTSRQRHVLSDRLTVEAISATPDAVVLEIGASAGTTSLDLLDKLDGKFGCFYVTDIYFELGYVIDGKTTYFYHPVDNNCIMRVTDRLLAYEDTAGAIFPLSGMAKRAFSSAPKIDRADIDHVSLVQPELLELSRSDSRIVIEEYDVFDSWPHEPVDVVKVANVLNKVYFSDSEILSALSTIKGAMKAGGVLVITDNRETEKVSVFAKGSDGAFVLSDQVNGGSEIQGLVESA